MITLFFDGLCEPVNPGGVATFGFALFGLPAPREQVVGAGVLGAGPGMTNNFAEWVACGRGLGFLVAGKVKPDGLTILGDSQLVINQLTGDWECRDERLRRCRDRCIEYLTRLGCRWKAEWVPREQNALADQLSAAVYVGRTGKPVPERPRKPKAGANR
ncbi:MAG TPA: ribonuclease HI family protein [Gemmata sp.]